MAASRAFSEVIFLSKSVMVSNSFLGLEFNRQKKKALKLKAFILPAEDGT